MADLPEKPKNYSNVNVYQNSVTKDQMITHTGDNGWITSWNLGDASIAIWVVDDPHNKKTYFHYSGVFEIKEFAEKIEFANMYGKEK